MHKAAEKGKHLRLKPYLSGDLEALDAQGRTALIYAASNGHLRCVNMLLEAKAQVDGLGPYSVTPLMSACRDGHLDVVHALLEARADMNRMTIRKPQAALHFACSRPSNTPVVAALLAAGAHVIAPHPTPSLTEVALVNSSLETLKLLIAAGLNPTDGFRFAIMHDNIDAVKMLINSKIDVDAPSKDNGKTPLYNAITFGYVDMVEFLLSAGADVNARCSEGLTYLHRVSEMHESSSPQRDTTGDVDWFDRPQTAHIRDVRPDYPGIVSALISAKADLSIPNSAGLTPLMYAARCDQVHVMKALLDAGVEVDETTHNGLTALMSAAAGGSLEAIRFLVGAGADLDHYDNEDSTALHIAVALQYYDVVECLLDAGAYVNVCGIDADVASTSTGTPLDIAITRSGKPRHLALFDFSHRSMARLLHNAGGMTWDEVVEFHYALVRAVKEGNIQAVKQLLPISRQLEKDCAIAYAARKNKHQMIKYLISGGANPSLTFRQANILYFACFDNFPDVVRELIDGGADISAKDTLSGFSPIKIAAKRKHREIVALLLAKANELKKTSGCD